MTAYPPFAGDFDNVAGAERGSRVGDEERFKFQEMLMRISVESAMLGIIATGGIPF